MFAFLSAGLVFGLSAGFSPGPLLALVIAQSVQHGIREGLKVAAAPLITDVPIVLAVTLLLTRLPQTDAVLGVIALAGGLFVLYLAYESWRVKPLAAGAPANAPQSLRRGALVNFFSPHPYLFWLTVGSPTMLRAWRESPPAAVAFVLGFYICLVGSKLVVALAAGRARGWLAGRPYVYLMRGLALLLLIFAILLFRDGVELLTDLTPL
jgi:threonine/homoserine/homoserine lactone efflux protein